ncbi:MAG: amidohydrolase family protein [Bacteroidia bacterium]
MEEEKLEEEVNLDYVIHNVHCHVFNIDFLPERFIGWYLPTTLIKRKKVANFLFKLTRWLGFRLSSFIYSATKESQIDIFKELRGYYPKTAKFCPLTIDFDFMGAGKANKNYLAQLEDMRSILNDSKVGGSVLPFFCVDPRRDKVFDLMKSYIEDHGFKGIKLYPALGFFPDDPRLDEVYKYAEEHEIPITTHCIPTNKNHFRYKPSAEMIAKAKERFKFYEEKASSKPYRFAEYLNHPDNYTYVLEKYPKLKLNLAHFGGNDQWNKYLDVSDENHLINRNWYSIIRKMLMKYENVYSDISFTVHDDKLYPVLSNLLKSPTIQNKILFGSDFFMLQKDYGERRFGMDVRGYISDDEYWLIAESNPKRFLGLT